VRPADPFRGRRWADANRTRARSPVDPDLEPGDAAEPGRGHRRAPVPVHRRHAGVLLAIAAGGFLGALARYEMELTWPPHSGTFPASTFVINTSGAFLLGLVLTVSIERDRVHARTWRYVRLFSCVGFLGAWTTMSTVAVESDTLVRGGDALMALAYVAATIAAGVSAAVVGGAMGRLHRRVGGALEATILDGPALDATTLDAATVDDGEQR
jgi:CrcB protein